MILRYDPWKFVERAQSGSIQINLHPLHYSNEGMHYDQIMLNFFKRHVKNVDIHFKRNSGYNPLLKEKIFKIELENKL